MFPLGSILQIEGRLCNLDFLTWDFVTFNFALNSDYSTLKQRSILRANSSSITNIHRSLSISAEMDTNLNVWADAQVIHISTFLLINLK